MRTLKERWLNFWRPLRTWMKVLLAGAAIILFLFVFFVVGFETLHYTESTEFCSTCHDVMEPQVATHEISAHANVSCAGCHIGEGIEWKLYYKMSALRYLYTLPLQLYDRPLGSARDAMRSSEAVCAECHSPANAQGIKLFANYDYAPDEENSLTRLGMVLKIGDGVNPVGDESLGAHWHVTHPVTYIAEGEFRQEIPWVQVEKDGELVEYVDTQADLTALDIENAEQYVMECMDCHSREGHIIHQPNEMLDEFMAEELIPTDLPFIKAQGMAVLDERYFTEEEGLETIAASVRDFYETEYPELYASRQADVEQAIVQLGTIYKRTHFPHMNAYWNSYPNNEGHKEFPGCWRCHDGNHLNDANEAIPVSCDTCHAIPEVVGPAQELPTVTLHAQEKPESHESSLWIAEHRFRFDATCDDCHTVNNPGGSDDSSFCSNSGCHVGDDGEGWAHLDIDAPAVLALVLPEPQPAERRLPRIPHPINANTECSICHGLDEPLAYPEDHADYTSDECTDCHRLDASVAGDTQIDVDAAMPAEQPAAVSTPTGLQPPMIPHALAENENCLACHAVNSTIDPAPFTHSGFTNDVCQMCHELAAEFADVEPMSDAAEEDAPTPTPTAAPEETEAPTEAPAETPEPTPTAAEAEEDEEAAPVATDTPAAEPAAPADGAPLLTSHPVAGNENCLACHAVDSSIAPAPPTHAGFTNDSCERCHIPAQEDTPADAATPAPDADGGEGVTDTVTVGTVTTNTVTAESVTTSALAAPPAIPHPVAAWADCRSCHAAENAIARDIAPMPADHSTFQNDMCQMCHDSAAR